MNVLYLVSAGGAAMRRSVRSAIATAAPLHELRMLAPDAESKALRDCGVRSESWRPAGLFNVLRAIGVLRRAVERYEPDAIHAFGWTAAAVALGALPARYAGRTLVTLQDPIRKNEMPKTFLEKRMPELLARSWLVECAYATLQRVLVETLGVPAEKVALVPYGVTPVCAPHVLRPAGRRGPIVGYPGRLESDRAWQTVVDALARLVVKEPGAQLLLGRSGPVSGLVRSHARTIGVIDRVTFADDISAAELFAGIDMLVVPAMYDGLPYSVVESLVNGIPLIGADVPGIADTLDPYAGWIVPDSAAGFAAGIREAWAGIDEAWSAAQAQREQTESVFCAQARARDLLANYERMAAAPIGAIAAGPVEISG